MSRISWSFSSELARCLLAVLAVAATTGVLLLLGRAIPDRILLALSYLLPVGWSAARWGRWPCTCAALAAILAGEFLFLPPVYALTLEGLAAWLLLAVLLVGANVLASRMQAELARSQDSVYQEYQAVFVHGLSTALAGLRTPEAVIQVLARYFHELLQARRVEVRTQRGLSLHWMACAPADGRAEGAPDRVLPLRPAPDLAGEIRLWGDGWLPTEDSYLFRSLAAQAELALARVSLPEAEPCADAFVPAKATVSVTASAAVPGTTNAK